MVEGKLPTSGVFVLGLTQYAVRGAKSRDLPRLACWIEAAAARLEYGPRPWTPMEAGPPEVPFPGRLGRWGMGPHGKLRAVEFTAEEDRQDLLRASVRNALVGNLPKLKAESARGRLTMLVFERVEVGLMNVAGVADALRAECAAMGLGDVPHWILLAEPVFGAPWPLSFLKEGGALWPDVPAPGTYWIPGASPAWGGPCCVRGVLGNSPWQGDLMGRAFPYATGARKKDQDLR